MAAVLWSPILAVIAGFFTFVRVRERARRQSTQNAILEIALPPWLALRPHRVAFDAGMGILLTLAIEPFLRALVASGATGTVAVAAAGVGLGIAGFPQLAFGAALCQALWLPGSAVTTVWALPVAVGYLVRLVHLDPHVWRGYTALLYAFDREGQVVRGDVPAEWFWRGLQAGTVVLPVSLVALVPAPHAGLLEEAARWTGAGLLAVQFAAYDRIERTMANRTFRLVRRVLVVLSRVTAVAVAAGPVGAWLAAGWAGVGYLTGLPGGLLLAGAATAAWVLPMAVHERTGRTPRWTALLAATRPALRNGMIPVLLALLQPVPGLAVTAAVLAAAEVLTLRSRLSRHRDHLLVWHAASLIWYDHLVLRHLGGWLHDALLSRPARPDLALPRTLGGLAALSARGQMVPGQYPPVRADPALRRPLAGMAAARWTDLAERALDLVDAEVVPRFPRRHLAALEGTKAVARAELSWARALVLLLVGQQEAAVDQWRDAARRFGRLGAPVHELLARLIAVHLLAVPLARPADARREYARVRLPGALPAAARKLSLLADVSLAPVDRDQEMRTALAEAAAIRAGEREVRAALSSDTRLPAPDRRQCAALAEVIIRAQSDLRLRARDACRGGKGR